jgi:ribosomal protein S16
VKLDRVDYWISQGARPTDAVARIVKQVRKDAAVAEA